MSPFLNPSYDSNAGNEGNTSFSSAPVLPRDEIDVFAEVKDKGHCCKMDQSIFTENEGLDDTSRSMSQVRYMEYIRRIQANADIYSNLYFY